MLAFAPGELSTLISNPGNILTIGPKIGAAFDAAHLPCPPLSIMVSYLKAYGEYSQLFVIEL